MLLKYLLLGPLSLLYGLGVDIRNRLFDWRLLKIREFDVPIICIGNITVGGTGKTPHTEALIGELRRDFRVACLSRGYKRRTSGFVLATPESTAKDIGDEPMQIKSKFPDIIVAVDGNRARAIERLSQSEDKPEVIILDDGFQHRSVKADINILLVDFNRPVNEDHLLPLGRLRESVHAMGRANYVIVTKCPANISPIEKRIIANRLDLKAYQQLLFTSMRYGSIRKIDGSAADSAPSEDSTILCVTGIANPQPYLEHLKTLTSKIEHIRFPDHHNFKETDIQRITEEFDHIPSQEKHIFTTEKDAMRLKLCDMPAKAKEHLYYIPIEPAPLTPMEQLIKNIHDHVRKNQRK